MRTIDFYLDSARDGERIKSDRGLGRALLLSAATVGSWRTRRAWPTDDSMVTLAALAGVDRREALLELNIWRTTGEAAQVYLSMLNDLAETGSLRPVTACRRAPRPAA